METRTNNPSIRNEDEDKSQQNSVDPPVAPDRALKRGSRWILTWIALYSTNFLYGLDTTIAANVQPEVIVTFEDLKKLAWIGLGFPLGSVALIMPLGHAYGMFNIKTLYLSAVLLFEAGSALCGGANNINALIVGRVIAGAGGAGMYLGVLNYVAALTEEKERSMYNALVGMVFGTGLISGPLIGGAFASSSLTWRWAFYINLCIAGVSVPVLLFCVPSYSRNATDTWVRRLRNLDWFGSFLLGASYITFAIALTFAGGQWDWASGGTISMFVIFGVVTISFVAQQHFCILTTREHRIFPAHLLRQRTLVLQFVGNACSTGALFVVLYYLPLLFQFANTDSAIKSALRLLPLICANIFFIMLNGALMPLVGYYMPWHIFSGILLIIGGSLMFHVRIDTKPANIYGYAVLIGAGCGMTLQLAYSVIAFAVTPKKDLPGAIGVINISQIGTGAIAFPIAAAIFQNRAFENLQVALAGEEGGGLFSSADLHQLIAGSKSELLQKSPPEVREEALRAIIDAMDQVYIMIIAAGALSVVAALAMKRERMYNK